MKIFNTQENIYDAVDCIVKYGVIVVEETRISISNYIKKLKKCLEAYPDIDITIGYQNVEYNGYFYYIQDLNKFSIGSNELKTIINNIDKIHKILLLS